MSGGHVLCLTEEGRTLRCGEEEEGALGGEPRVCWARGRKSHPGSRTASSFVQ